MPLFLSALVAALLFAAPVPVSAADQRNVTFVNDTGYDINFVGVNKPGDEDLSDNEISRILPDGGNVYIKFNRADPGCVWNIRIRWASDNSTATMRGINLCQVEEVTPEWDDATSTASYRAR